MSEEIRKVSLELQNIARELDKRIEDGAGKRIGFSLFVWTDGRCNYVSSVDRAEVIQVLEGMIKGWKAGMPDAPAHEIVG